MSRLLTTAAATATVVTASVAAMRFSSRHDLPDIPEQHRPRLVPNWRQYGSVGAVLQPTAPVTIVGFSDYLCSHCAAAFSTLQVLSRDYPHQVAVVWRNYPFLGAESMTAALASICARRVGGFETMHERLFAEVDSLGRKPWARIASEAGIPDTSAFGACLLDDAALEVVRRDVAAARELAVRGTPAVLLDSLLFQGAPGLNYLRAYMGKATAALR